MHERRHAKGVTRGASRGRRNHAAARGVSGRHAARRGARLADDGPDGGRGGRSGLVSSELPDRPERSEEHTSELQSPCNLVCRLLLEKKKNKQLTSKHGRYTRP